MNSVLPGRRRVAVLMDRLPPGSSAKVAGEEVRQLNDLGLNTELLLVRNEVSEKDTEHLNGVKITCFEDLLPKILTRGIKIPGFSFFSSFHLTAPMFAPIVRLNYDLMIAHGTYTCFTAYSFKKFRNIRYIAFIWDPITYILRKVYSATPVALAFPVLTPMGIKLDKTVADASEVVVLPSKFHQDLMKKLTSRPIETVYPGVIASARLPEKRGDFMLAVARWEHGKRPAFYLDLLEKLRQENSLGRLVMAGPWREPRLLVEFLRQVNERGLRGSVTLLGHPNQDELVRLYRQARVLVHASTESFGMIGLEAAAHGCPFIIPRNSGVTELFVEGVHGFFPPESDIDAYTECVCKIIEDERLAFDMGREAWSSARNFTWKRHAQRLANVLSGLLG